ncbi:MAG: hypothetical protein K0R38_2589 [Polyangiaceae bacterium]|nr:hypothetical protein [Polyangiaceae bacterium]
MTRASLRWSSLREQLRTSLWPTPVGVTVACAGAALGLARLDHQLSSDFAAWYSYGGRAAGARELLSTIASSMLAIAGLVFSITILVLQLASSQFSPRVLRTFLQDTVTQWAMGMFLGSFVYALVLLPEVRSESPGGPDFVPGIAIFGAFILALSSIAFFVRYIHHMAHSIRASTIVARVARETHESIQRLYPEGVLEGATASGKLPTEPPTRIVRNSAEAGVVIDVDVEALMRVAVERDLVIAVLQHPGDFVPLGAPMVHLWGACDVADAEAERWVVLAQERTPHQDVAFGFRQFVDIAARALSPGINDPTTAVQVIDRLHDLLRSLVQRDIPQPARVDGGGRLRLVLPRPDFADYLQLSFEEIRLYGASSVQVTRRVRAALRDLATVANADRTRMLEREEALFERAAALEAHSSA